jgi:hypothetical protein
VLRFPSINSRLPFHRFSLTVLSVVCWSCLGRWRYMIRFKAGLNWCTIST